MIVNRFYMHKNCLDVCFAVVRMFPDQPHPNKPIRAYLVEGMWYNLGYSGRPWPCSDMEQIFIEQGRLGEWTDVTPNLHLVRSMPGVPK